MASTNHTTNYNLSQFIGADKPAWLSDYNGDMGKIDAGIAAAASTATGADGKADANTTKIGTLANLTTTDKTSCVAAINEVDANADTAQGTANAAGNIANQAKTTADGLVTYLNINTFGTGTITSSDGATITAGTVRYGVNSDGSLGKVYGAVVYTPVSAPTLTITTGLRPSSQFTILDGAIIQDGNDKELYTKDITVGTDGKISISLQAYFNNRRIKVIFQPYLIFAKDFGDQA